MRAIHEFIRPGAAAALATLMALVLVGCASGEEPGGGPDRPAGEATRAAKAPLQVLEPKSTIRVGKHRYLSPCQLLDAGLVHDAMGKDQPYEVHFEHFLDASVPRKDVRPDAVRHLDPQCAYSWSDNSMLSLAERLFPDADKAAGALGSRSGITIAPYQRLRDDLGEQAGKLLDDAVLGAAVVKARESSPSAGLPGQWTTVITERESIGHLVVGVSFLVGNAIVDLEHSLGDDHPPLTDEDRVAELELLATLVGEVRERAADPSLSQAPEPTNLLGETHYGATPFLEACAVLDRATFRKLTGLPDNDLVERSRTANAHEGRPGRTGDGITDLSRAGCTREYSVDNDPKPAPAVVQRLGPRGSASVRVDLSTFPDEAAADAAWQEWADGATARAARGVDAMTFGKTGAQFRVGNHIVFVAWYGLRLSADVLSDHGTSLRPSRTDLVHFATVVSARVRALDKGAGPAQASATRSP